MIQRIQTLYLFIALCAAVLLFFFPFAKYFTGGGEHLEFMLTGMFRVSEDIRTLEMVPILMLSLHIVIAILIFVSIFMFKKRVTQMRVVAIAFLLNAILIGTIFYFSDKFGEAYSVQPNYKNIGTLLPVLMLIMLLIANKAIRKDEVKMRKSSRIR